MKEIILPSKDIVMVDDEDYETVTKYRWFARPGRKTKYAFFQENAHKKGPKNIFMHRVIMGLTDTTKIIDHIDGNGLNNQKSNLRIATIAQNLANRGKPKKKSALYKGVRKYQNRFSAAIRFNYKYVYLGVYGTEAEAAKAYDKAAREFFGEFANLNFPNDWRKEQN